MNGFADSTSTRQMTLSAFIGALISSGVVTFIGEQAAARRTERVVQQVRAEFAKRESLDEWKRQSLASLLGPAIMQLDRTRRAFLRYEANKRFLESEILYKGNLAVRDLLLTNAYLIPPELSVVSGKLVEHYDRWLEEYDRVRGPRSRALNEPFVFAGDKGYPFPSEADSLFKAAYRRLWTDLYAPVGVSDGDVTTPK
jgi:hypothetical protein